MWEKDIILVIGIVSTSHNFFQRPFQISDCAGKSFCHFQHYFILAVASFTYPCFPVISLTLSWFLRVCSTSLLKTLCENEKLFVTSNSPFPTVFFTRLESFLPFSSNLKLLSATSFSLEGSKICCLGKG